MSSVSIDVLTHVNTPFIVGIAGYYVPEEGTQHVIVGATSDNDILTEVYWKPGQGVKQDVLTHLNAAGGPGGGYYVPAEGTQHVIAGTRVGDLIEVYWKSGQGVKQRVLTNFTLFFTGLPAYYVPAEGTQHVIVGSTDSDTGANGTVGIITEVYWRSGQGVKQDELARFNGSISVLGAYYVPAEGTQHAIVVTPDGNLTEMYWQSGQGVKQDVLLPHDGRRGTAFYSADDNTQHVVLVSADGTLTDVHWQSGQGIHQDRLTQLSSITSIFDINGLTGYYSANDQKRHVIVATGDGTLTEVYW